MNRTHDRRLIFARSAALRSWRQFGSKSRADENICPVPGSTFSRYCGRVACIAAWTSRAFLTAFSANRICLAAARLEASAARDCWRSAAAGSAALARNYAIAAFPACASAFCRSLKSGSLNRPISSDLLRALA